MDTILVKGTKNLDVDDFIELLEDNEIVMEHDVLKYPDCMLVFVKQWFDNERVYDIIRQLKMSVDESIELVLDEHTFYISAMRDYDNCLDDELERFVYNNSFQEYEWLHKYEKDEFHYELNVVTTLLETLHLDD